MEDSFDNSVEKALVEIKKRTHSTDSWLCISEDGYKITNPEKYEDISLQCDINTIDLSKLCNLKRLSIRSNSHGDLYGIPIPKAFSVSIFFKWEYLKQFCFDDAEDLELCIEPTEEEISISSGNLKRLKLSFRPMDGEFHSVHLNLTGCENLETLILSGITLVDTKNIEFLPSLKVLNARECSIPSLSWIKEYDLLNALFLEHCNITRLEGIEALQHLERISLSGNNISDLTPLMGLKSLKKLNVINNPVSRIQVEELRNNNVFVIATRQDRDLMYLDDVGDERFLQTAVQAQLQEDLKPIEQFPVYQQKYISESRKLSFNDRLKDNIQRRFQSFFYSITPWSAYGAVNNWQYREYYMNSMLDKYPFLKIQDHMTEAISLEKQKYCDPAKNNRLVFIQSNDIVCIEVAITPDKTGLTINHEPSFRLNGIEKLVVKHWPSEYEGILQDNYLEISIVGKYSGLEAESLVFPVIISVLAYSKGYCDGKKAIIGDFKVNGTLKKEAASDKNISIAENEGAKNVFMYGKAASYDKKTLSQHNLNYYYVKDYKDIIGKMLEIKTDGFEQISLMDLM
jgi:hypothetical protein